MKKTLVLMLIAVFALELSGCSSKEEAKSTSEAKEAEPVQASASAGTDGDNKPELVFRYGEVNPEGNIMASVGHKFAEYVDELSDGRIKIEVYPGNVLGDERDSLNSLKRGGTIVDMYRGNTNALTGYGFKKLSMFGLPYIFNDREGMWKVLEDASLGQAFLWEGTEVGANMVGLFYTDEGTRDIFTTQEVSSLADISGKKIRVPESVLMMDTMSALGAMPIPMPYEDLYHALETGEVEGAENPIPAYMSSQFYNVAPYVLLTGHVFSPGIVLMAEEKWNALSEKDQQILRKAGEMASEWNRNEILLEERRLYDELEEKGVVTTELTPEEKLQAREAEKIVRVSFTPGLEDYLERIARVQEE